MFPFLMFQPRVFLFGINLSEFGSPSKKSKQSPNFFLKQVESIFQDIFHNKQHPKKTGEK